MNGEDMRQGRDSLAEYDPVLVGVRPWGMWAKGHVFYPVYMV